MRPIVWPVAAFVLILGLSYALTPVEVCHAAPPGGFWCVAGPRGQLALHGYWPQK